MSRGEKIAAVLAAMTGLYFLLVKRTPALQARASTIPARVVDRVMLYAGDMFRYGVEQGVDPALVASVMTVESGGDASAIGTAGEIGLMQIMPSTGYWIANVTPEQLRQPGINIQTGAGYIRYCIDRKGGNIAAGVAGYNYGPDRVAVQNGTVIAPPVVLRYAASVMGLFPEYRRIFSDRLGFVYDNAFPA